MFRRLPRLSLLGTFSLLSLALTAALGLVVGGVLQQRIERRALRDAEQLAQTIARVGVQSRLRPGELELGIGPKRVRQLRAELADADLAGIKIFDRSGRIVFSDNPELIDRDASHSPSIVAGLRDEGHSEVEEGVNDDGHGVRTLEVYVPLRRRGQTRPEGVLEIYLPYGPVGAAIADDTRTLVALLAGGLLCLWLVLFRIVSRASRRLRYQALYDGLTGLPNRELLQDRLRRALAGIGDDGCMVALLLLDLDRFKEVNDTLGHDHGDALLGDVAARLRGALRRGDTLARLGGDEFAVLLPGVPDRAAVAELAARLRDALRDPFDVRGVAVELEASVGIALAPDHGDDVMTLVKRADVAMYEAKRTRAGIVTYARDRDPYSPDRLTLLCELRHAIDHDELVLHFQPKVGLADGEVNGVEALVRWEHPRRGLIPPCDFVPLTERTGAIHDLTRWVLDAALRQTRQWRDAGLDLPVAVNLASANVVDVGLPALVAERLERWGVPGDRLECEISEHTVMADPERALEVLGRLRALGVRLSLDDFGTGRSSLSYLKRLPLDDVKIDRSFVAGMTEDAGDLAIVRSTIELARSLSLGVVAEGVETEAVRDRLAGLRCDTAQGFLLSRPLPAADLEDWLAARPAAA